MISAAIYRPDGGFTGQFVGGPSVDYIDRATPDGCLAWVYDGAPPNPARHRIREGELVEFQPPPPDPQDGVQWVWDADLWRWVERPTLNAVRRRRAAEVSALVIEQAAAPIRAEGLVFDADATARGRLLGTIVQLMHGLGLPAGWEGWRDHDNAMRWADDDEATVHAHLAAVARAIAEREQALLTTSWAIKSALDALQTVEALEAFDILAGWPAV